MDLHWILIPNRNLVFFQKEKKVLAIHRIHARFSHAVTDLCTRGLCLYLKFSVHLRKLAANLPDGRMPDRLLLPAGDISETSSSAFGNKTHHKLMLF
jgi:hypothetical protein